MGTRVSLKLHSRGQVYFGLTGLALVTQVTAVNVKGDNRGNMLPVMDGDLESMMGQTYIPLNHNLLYSYII